MRQWTKEPNDRTIISCWLWFLVLHLHRLLISLYVQINSHFVKKSKYFKTATLHRHWSSLHRFRERSFLMQWKKIRNILRRITIDAEIVLPKSLSMVYCWYMIQGKKSTNLFRFWSVFNLSKLNFKQIEPIWSFRNREMLLLPVSLYATNSWALEWVD